MSRLLPFDAVPRAPLAMRPARAPSIGVDCEQKLSRAADHAPAEGGSAIDQRAVRGVRASFQANRDDM